MERKLFNGGVGELFKIEGVDFVGFFTEDKVCLVNIKDSFITVMLKSDFEAGYLLFPIDEEVQMFHSLLNAFNYEFKDGIIKRIKDK